MPVHASLDDTPLAAITLDPELQPREKIDRAVLADYAQLLVDGAVFPPITVFNTGDQLLLADGFHRWHVHNALQLDTIRTEIINGSRRDALLYSLQANSKHGLRRNALDYTRAFEIALRHGLVDPTDDEAVARLLGCSVSYAEKLTRQEQARLKAERDAKILALKEAGQSNRAIARDTGIPHATVDRIVAAPNPPGGGNEAPLTDPLLSADPPSWKQTLDELAGEPARNWSSALRALRHVNEQPPVETLFADRYTAFDWVFGPELEKAYAWITELHERFHDERQPQRRRA